MKTIAKVAASMVLACGLASAATVPASAAVHVGIGFGAPVIAPAPSCYDVYGNYVYSYPYCTAYAAPYVAPGITFGFGGRGHGDFRDRERGGYQDRDHRVAHGYDRGDHGDRGRDHG